MNVRLDLLEPHAARAATAFVEKLRIAGIPFAVTSTIRTIDEQRALYAQGRMQLETVNTLRRLALMYQISESENKYTVTNADGVTRKSAHQYGNALDVVPAYQGRAMWPKADDPRWLQIGEIGESCGFEWGGRWKDFPDRPHYEIKEKT